MAAIAAWRQATHMSGSSWQDTTMRGAAVLFIFGSFAASANAQETGTHKGFADAPVGSIVSVCKDCPVFVRVPPAPSGMRRILFVSRFELTWKNYLAAVDEKRCPIPKPYRVGLDAEKLKRSDAVVADNLNKFRVDWPIEALGTTDIQCYIGWLQEKAGYHVSLPSKVEWEWFARAGKADIRFPWGDEVDPSREALLGSKVSPADEFATPDIHDSWAQPSGVRVGLFPPNPWGIHDLMGNVRELTSDIVTGEQWLQRHPTGIVGSNMHQRDRVVVKGSDRSSRDWDTGISGTSYTSIWDGRYAGLAGVRLVLSD